MEPSRPRLIPRDPRIGNGRLSFGAQDVNPPDRVANPNQEPKNMLMFCDGTWKDAANESRNPTNVFRLATCISQRNVNGDGRIQTVAYQSGVGTRTSGFAAFRAVGNIVGGTTGRGKNSVVPV
jgi:uncharacterized protein (DUF2235 family)